MARKTAADLAVGDEALHRFRQGLGRRDLPSGSDVKFLRRAEKRNAGFVKTSIGSVEQKRLRDAARSECPCKFGRAFLRTVCRGVQHAIWEFPNFIMKTILRKLQRKRLF